MKKLAFSIFMYNFFLYKDLQKSILKNIDTPDKIRISSFELGT